MRPCPAVQQHMIDLLDKHPKLRFSYGAAEQDFLNWCVLEVRQSLVHCHVSSPQAIALLLSFVCVLR